jgi:hypothetical protein
MDWGTAVQGTQGSGVRTTLENSEKVKWRNSANFWLKIAEFRRKMGRRGSSSLLAISS